MTANQTGAHTPGKWIVRQLTHCLAVFVEHSPSDRIMICQVAETATKADEPDRAPFDAALIASAPELLAALEDMLKDNAGRQEWENARAAIAKAKLTTP